MFFDSHAHLTLTDVASKATEMIKRAKENSVDKIINVCTDRMSLEHGLRLAAKYDCIFTAAATTPHDVEKEGEAFFPMVEEAIKNKKLVAIGEIGLDYYYEFSKKEIQKKYFKKYLNLAQENNLPVIIHVRDAFKDLFSVADEVYKDKPALIHCFTGTYEEAKKALDRGWLLSFSGIITFKNSNTLREILKKIPMDRILIETDTPLLAPQSKRGKMNEPSFLPEIAQTVANMKNTSLEDVENITYQNTLNYFKMK